MKAYITFLFLFCCNISLSDELPEKIRCIWHYGGDSPVYKTFSDVGLNAGSFQFFPLKQASIGQINKNELAKWEITVKLAKANDILPFAKLCTFGDWVAKILKRNEFSYRHVVTETGQRCGLTPCPIERKFWINVWKPIFIRVAEILKRENCPGGILLENESYSFGTIYPGFWDMRKRYCFCDDCFSRFIESRRLKIEKLPAPNKRAEWIDKRGLSCEYEKFMETEFAKIINELTQAARNIWPKFYVAQYPYFPQWFCDGIIKGSSDDAHPCLLFSHIEYFTGFTRFSAQREKYLSAMNFNVKYLGGLTIGYYKPELLAEKISELIDKADGYWLYWGGTLTSSDWRNRLPGGKDFKKLSHEYRLLASPDEYWRMIKKANENKIEFPAGHEINKYVCLKKLFDKTNWLKREWHNPVKKQIKGNKIIFGPDNGRFRGNWYIQTTISVPKNSWLRLSADVIIKGKEKFTHVGFGKLNWYNWSILQPSNKSTKIIRIIKLSNSPSLLIRGKNDKIPQKQITIRFHVKPTENIVLLNEIKAELISPLRQK